jgi:phenylalanyl-tRNA synthetase beta chain
MGEVNPDQLAKLELRGACSATEIEFAVLMQQAQLVPLYRPLPAFPAVVRDLSLVVPRSLSWADLRAAVVEAAGPTLAAVEYLDTFQGGNLREDEQSVHFGMTFRHHERTLTGDEVDHDVKAVVDACATRMGAKLRT